MFSLRYQSIYVCLLTINLAGLKKETTAESTAWAFLTLCDGLEYGFLRKYLI